MYEKGTRFSVILPVYNGEKYIRESVNSVKRQTFPGWELIIVNDGSTDCTLKICRELENGDVRIKVIDKVNSGVSHSRNVALECARGDYIVFLDADDMLAYNCLEVMLDCIEKDTCELVICNHFFLYGERVKEAGKINIGEELHGIEHIAGLIEFSLKMSEGNQTKYYGNLRTVWGKCFCRRIIHNCRIRFTSGLKYGEDMVFVLNYIMNVDKVRFRDESVYYYRVNKFSVMHTRKWKDSLQGELYYEEVENAVKKFCNRYGEIFEVESALAVLWLETAKNDWESILGEKISLLRKHGIIRQLIDRELYVRFSREGAYLYSSKKQWGYMFLIRHKMVLLLMLLFQISIKKQHIMIRIKE